MNMCRVLPHILVVIVAGLLTASCSSSSFSGGSESPNRSANNVAVQTPSPTPAVPTATPAPEPTYPANAVTQGSFKVWATPSNPAPGQPYSIHIAVNLGEVKQSYLSSDLTGSVVGTDTYSQQINGFEIFPNKNTRTAVGQQFLFTPGTSSAEFIMVIPGAVVNVQDTISVRSAMLNESQVISVVFK